MPSEYSTRALVTFIKFIVTVLALCGCSNCQLWWSFYTSPLIILRSELFRMLHRMTGPRHSRVTDGRPRMVAIHTRQMLSFPLYHGILSSSLCGLVSKDAVYGTHARRVFAVTDAFLNKSITNLPCKNRRVLLLILHNFVHYGRRGHLRFASSDRTRTYGACFVKPSQDFTYTSVWYQKASRNFAGSDATCCKLHDPVANVIRKRPTIHERPAELIDSAMALEKKGGCRGKKMFVSNPLVLFSTESWSPSYEKNLFSIF